MSISLSGSLLLTGSLTVTGEITMSGSIASASYATTASYALTASYVEGGGGSSVMVAGTGTCSILGNGCANAAGGNCSFTGGGFHNNAPANGSTLSGGYCNTTSGLYASLVGGVLNTADGGRSFVGGGQYNTASGCYAAIAGGVRNTASGRKSFIGGGQCNTASGYYSFVGGGCCNTASGYSNALVLGGSSNTACAGFFSSVLGGCSNVSLACHSVVLGGSGNLATGLYTGVFGCNLANCNACTFMANNFVIGDFIGCNGCSLALDASGKMCIGSSGGIIVADTGICSTVRCGVNNCASGNYSFVGGGASGSASGCNSFIGSGFCNVATGNYSAIGGGFCNTTSGVYSSIGGGVCNIACGYYTVVAGGSFNCAVANTSAVLGGNSNCALCFYTAIAGGYFNKACNCYAAIGSGFSNTASGKYSFIGSGLYNTASGKYSFIGSGDHNCATGCRSAVAGGGCNCACGYASFVGGGFCNVACGANSSIVGGQYNTICGFNSSILGGCNNILGNCNSFIIGSGLTSNADSTTFVNCLSVAGTGNFASDLTGQASLKSVGRIFTVSDTNYGDLTSTSGSLVMSFDATGQQGYLTSRNYATATDKPLNYNGSVHIFNGGNVGIGISSPQVLLHLYDASLPRLQFSNSTTGTASTDGFQLYQSGLTAIITNKEAGDVVFGTSDTERMRITSGGNIAIGTSAVNSNERLTIARASGNASIKAASDNGGNLVLDSYSASGQVYLQNYVAGDVFMVLGGGSVGIRTSGPQAPFHVAATGTAMIIGEVGGSAKQLLFGIDSGTGTSELQSVWQGTAYTRLNLNPNGGAVYAGATRLDNLSDERVKDNIQPIENALDKVLSITGKKFHLKDEEEGKVRYGFIAQELEGILDEFVIQTNTTFKKDDLEVENVKSIENWASSWSALLVEAIKEQQATIQELTTRITALENK